MSKTRKDIAVEAFTNNDALEVVYVTKDLQPFGVISDGQNYARKFKTPEDRKLETFTRKDLKVKPQKVSKNRVVDAVKAIKKCENESEVKELIAAEIRPFVLAQAKIKLKELGVDTEAVKTSKTELETLRAQNEQLQKDKDAAVNDATEATKKLKEATSNKTAKKRSAKKKAASNESTSETKETKTQN